MSRAWKVLLLVGGIAGVVGFFLPFVEFASKDRTLEGGISAYQMVRGIDDVRELIAGAQPMTAALDAEMRRFVETFNDELAAYRGVLVAFYAPAAALALLGALAGIRRRIGRLAGAIAALLGVASAGVWLLFHEAAARDHDATVAIGLGLHALLAAGVLGLVAGLGALISPDRGGGRGA